MRWKMVGVAIVVGSVLSAGLVHAAVWRGSWAASPTASDGGDNNLPAIFRSPQIHDQTVAQHLRLSAGGRLLRLRLSNEFGAIPLAIGRVRVALEDSQGHVIPGSERDVTFSDAHSTTIPPAAPLMSDPIDLAVAPLAKLRVSIYFPGAAGPCSCHRLGLDVADISPPGDFTDKAFTPASATYARTFLSAVEVESPRPAPVIVAFGDSITDGFGSTRAAHMSWPDQLAERLTSGEGRGSAVVNAGISGNRVLGQYASPLGQSALARFDRDVLSVPGATHVIMLEGINDIGGDPKVTAGMLIAGYRQVIARAHAHGLKLILGTITPFLGTTYERADGESVRLAVNAWIRSQHEADGVIDFDLAVRDPKILSKMRADFQSGDWLHPNDAGYRAMAAAIPLALLR